MPLNKKFLPLLIFFCILILIGFHYLLNKFTQQKISNLNVERDDLIQNGKNIFDYKMKYGEIDNLIEVLEENYQLACISLPDKMNQGEFINFLQTTALENQIKIVSMIPNSIESIDESELNKLPIEIKIECTYIQLINFLKTIEYSERLIQIENLSIIGNDKDDEKIFCNMNLNIFSQNKIPNQSQ